MFNQGYITKDEWAEQCTCQVKTINGVKWYYEIDGQVFTKDDTPGKTEAEAAAIIVEECFPCQEIEFDGTTYFVGKKGNIVASKEEMDKECEIPKCKVVDDKYYDKDGKEITEEEYNKQCKCRIEENENGKLYYNDKNELISAEEYANQCQPSVPTGASIPYMMIAVGGLLTLVTLVFILRNKSKLKRI